MIKHYNAFISYRHAKVDSRVAAQVQRSLERYHIPGKIRRKTGVKKIERVFRDKDELPITSNLGDDISYALANADYLIVICSPRTKESIWVTREIEYFLQNHTKDKILTVLAEGEPQDVIPEILLSDEVVTVDETTGEEIKKTVPIEPLSCDYRLPAGQAAREELPRLAATMIGCSYDELMNRARQYRMRRLSLIFSLILAVVLGFAGYMYYSRMRLDESYKEVLKNHSIYLANESGKLLEDEQRMDALQLALAALPSEDHPEIPVTPEAVRALTDASMAYVTLGGTNISAAWNYQMNNNILEMLVSRDGTKLAARDIKNNIMVWDTATHQVIFHLDRVEDLRNFVFAEGGILLVADYDKITAYDLENSAMIWDMECPKYTTLVGSSIQMGEEYICLILDNGLVQKIHSADGKVEQTWQIPHSEDGEGSFYFSKCVLSPSKNRIGFYARFLQEGELCGVYDLETGEVIYKKFEEDVGKVVPGWATDDRFVIATMEDGMDGSMQMYDHYIMMTEHTKLTCMDARDLTVLWETDFTFNDVAMRSEFLALSEKESIAYYQGNMCRIYDVETGEMLYEHNANDPIVDASDNDHNGDPIYISRGGASISPMTYMGTDVLSMTFPFTDELNQAIVNKGVYARKYLSSQIIFYGVYVHDEEWTVFENAGNLETILDTAYTMDDEYLITLTRNGSVYDDVVLTVFDLEQTKQIFQTVVTGEEAKYYQYSILGHAGDVCYLFRDALQGQYLVKVDLASGTVKELEEEEATAELSNKEGLDEIWKTYSDALVEATTYGSEEEEDHTPEYLMRDPDRELMGYMDWETEGRKVTIAAYNDGALCKYDAETRELLGSTGLSRYANGTYECRFLMDEEKDRLYIQISKLTDVVELSSFVEIACVQNSLGYDKTRDRFITTAEGDGYENTVGFFRQYTLEELIQKGRDVLQDSEMSEEMKAAYGIE